MFIRYWVFQIKRGLVCTPFLCLYSTAAIYHHGTRVTPCGPFNERSHERLLISMLLYSKSYYHSIVCNQFLTSFIFQSILHDSHKEVQMLTRARCSVILLWEGKELILVGRKQTTNKPTQMGVTNNNKRLYNNDECSQFSVSQALAPFKWQ